MRYSSVTADRVDTIAVRRGDRLYDLRQVDSGLPAGLDRLLVDGLLPRAAEAAGLAGAPAALDPVRVRYRPVLEQPGEIICVGRNYAAHARKGGVEPPSYPEFFFRAPTSLVGHGEPLLNPRRSDKLDFEAELVVVIGQRDKHVSRSAALDVIAGYSIFNDGSLRDYQRKSSQWTIGKNFDRTGSFGPELVTCDEVPPGGEGLRVVTRLNAGVMQDDSTDNMIFSVPLLIEALTECLTLEPGDVIVAGTPHGVGYARTPPVFMKAGDRVEVEITTLGILSNTIADETPDLS